MTFVLASHVAKPAVKNILEDIAANKTALDLFERSFSILEEDLNVNYIGAGSDTNILGKLQLDAACMLGDTRSYGAVAALEDYPHAFKLARRVLEVLPHNMLVGAGAKTFAAEQGFSKSGLESEACLKRLEKVLNENKVDSTKSLSEKVKQVIDSDVHRDTVVMLAKQGNSLFAGTSTSGWPYKYPGRVGDSPIPGAGFYADSRYGACVCTHTGEMTMRALTSFNVVRMLAEKKSLYDAVNFAMQDLLSLQGGFLGPVVIHAVNKDFEHYCLTNCIHPVNYYLISKDIKENVVNKI